MSVLEILTTNILKVKEIEQSLMVVKCCCFVGTLIHFRLLVPANITSIVPFRNTKE